ncbi:MAG: hypothetical protein ACXVZR_06945 [Terriglobales bacterium]
MSRAKTLSPCRQRGKETVEHIVRMFAGHDLNHLQQIERILANSK